MKKSTTTVVNVPGFEFPGSIQPIDPSTAFDHIDSNELPYPRYFNTSNQSSVAAKIAALESAEAGLVFGSGMAAISTTLTALLKPGDHAIFLKGLYGGSHTFVTNELADRQVEFSFVEKEVASFEAAIKDNTRLIYVESPTNPLLEIVDLATIAKLAREQNIVTVIDNTFATPIHQNPIELGFDVVVHSGTKYLGGHSDLSCGAVVASNALMQMIHQKAKHFGGNLNALSVYLLDRSLKTLDVRVQRQTENANKIAEFLESLQWVTKVYYPGLSSHEGHQIARNQMQDFGAMMAFELEDSVPVTTFLKNLKLVRAALSLGGVESSVCVPATTSHHGIPKNELDKMNITPQVVRLSVGIEDAEDLKLDLKNALLATLESVPQRVS